MSRISRCRSRSRDRFVGVGRLEGRVLRRGAGRLAHARLDPVLDQVRGAPGRRVRPAQERHERPPVGERRCPRAGHRLERGCEVGVAGQLGHVRARPHARPANQQGDVDVGLVRRLLPRRHAVLAEVEAVVRREHDVGVVELLGGPQRAHETRHAPVDGLQRPDAHAVEVVDRTGLGRGERGQVAHEARHAAHVGLVEAGRARCLRERELGDVRGRRRRGLVRRVHRQVGEERLVVVRRAADEPVGEAGVHVGAVVAGPVPVHAVGLVLVQHVVVLGVRVAVDRARPVVPSRGHVVGRGPVRVAVEVLAGQRGRVARRRAAGSPRCPARCRWRTPARTRRCHRRSTTRRCCARTAPGGSWSAMGSTANCSRSSRRRSCRGRRGAPGCAAGSASRPCRGRRPARTGCWAASGSRPPRPRRPPAPGRARRPRAWSPPGGARCTARMDDCWAPGCSTASRMRAR